MKKSFLFLAALAMSAMMWAETATITFANQTSGTTDGNTAYTKDNFVGSGIASADDAFGTITCSETARCYSGKVGYGLKAGASSNAGSFTISFNALSNVSKIVLNRASYSASKTANITVKNGETTLADAVSTPSGSADFSDMEINDLDITSLSSLTVNTSKYCYIKSITITYDGTTPKKEVVDVRLTGEPTKMEYFVGESFDHAGLTVTAKYNDESTEDVTSEAKWTITPETFTEASENASVTVKAKVGEVESEPQTITGIVVKAKPAAKYVPVAWNEIEDGGKYFITAADGKEYYFAAKVFAAKGALAIEFDASMAPEADMWTFTKSGNAWKISEANGAGLYVTATNNGIVCAADKGADFTVAQGSSAEFTYLTASDGTDDRYVALYNQQDFRCYKTSAPSGIYDLKLYGLKKEGVVTKPSFSPSENDFDGSVEVTLTAEDGAAIYYTLDGSDPSVDGEWPFKIPYEASFTLTTTTTVKAIAVKDGKSSDVAEKTYSLIPVYTVEEIAAVTPTGQKAILVLNDDEIVKIDAGDKGDVSGIYFQATEKKIELYNQNYAFSKEWKVKGKVSGRVMGEWVDWKGQWELKIAQDQVANLNYTDPTDPTALQDVMMKSNIRKAMHNGRMFILKGDKMFNLQGMLVK